MSEPALKPSAGHELYARHARVAGRSVALLRAIDEGDRCVVLAEVWPRNSDTSVHPGPYTFPTPIEATRFVTHAVEAFIALGCEVAAS